MRLLFSLDKKDYDPSLPKFVRPSVRAIICREGKIAMVFSRKYGYYKFPGGGIEPGEDHLQALIRETREETGLEVIAETVREFGRVYRAQASGYGDVLVQDNFYYLCRVKTGAGEQNLDDYEQEEGFTLHFVTPEEAIAANRRAMETTLENDPVYSVMVQREAGVLELLVKENLI